MTDASVRMVVMRRSGRAFYAGINIKDIHEGRGLVRHHHRGAGCHRKKI